MKRGANHSVNVDRRFEHSMKPQIYFKMNTFTWFVFIDLNVLFNINYALGPNKSS